MDAALAAICGVAITAAGQIAVVYSNNRWQMRRDLQQAALTDKAREQDQDRDRLRERRDFLVEMIRTAHTARMDLEKALTTDDETVLGELRQSFYDHIRAFRMDEMVAEADGIGWECRDAASAVKGKLWDAFHAFFETQQSKGLESARRRLEDDLGQVSSAQGDFRQSIRKELGIP